MRQRNVKNQDEILSNCPFYTDDLASKKNSLKSKYTKISLEIGIGKGQFIYNLAKQNKDVLYIGIELNRGVVALATKKIARFMQEDKEELTNLILTSYNALNLNEIFNEGEVDTIYLNFSDPWPKKKHEKRRLTSDEFLKVYKAILKSECNIEFKTDNRKLFEYSIMNFNKNKMNIEFMSLNLHEDVASGVVESNIETEYEEKFSKFGPIYKCIVKF